MSETEQLWKKLEALGEEQVRLRVAQRAYGERKLPLVQEWLRLQEDRRQAQTQSSNSLRPVERETPTSLSQSSSTLYDRVVTQLKNNPLVVVALLLVALVAGLVKFREDLCSLYSPLCGAKKQEVVSFATHPAVGGEWFELAFSAHIKFRGDGTLEGTYYGHSFTGNWTPLPDGSLLFNASFTEPSPGIVMQWDFPVRVSVIGNNMELKWGRVSDTAVRR